MNTPESLEMFLQEASEHLQFLREYSSAIAESATEPELLERLHFAAHTLTGTSGGYGFSDFADVSSKMAHIFQYAQKATLSPETHAPLSGFLADAVLVLERDLLQISSDGSEASDEIEDFRQRYAFAFPAAEAAVPASEETGDFAGAEPDASGYGSDVPARSFSEQLPEDGEVPAEILEFFVPETEEHLLAVTECLLAIEGHPNAEETNRLFRAMHTIKGSAAQVGLHRLSAVAHRVEDLIGHVRDGVLVPNAELVDVSLEAVDVLKKFLYRDWPDEESMRAKIDPLVARMSAIMADAGVLDASAALPESAESGLETGSPAITADESFPAPAAGYAEEFSGIGGGTAELPMEPTQTHPAAHAAPVASFISARPAPPAAAAASASASSASLSEIVAGKSVSPAVPQAKSVRISLEQLDRMMNAVGELVINRTRMLGRLKELSKLVEILAFSKSRLSGKVAEFQEKHEFNRISAYLAPGSMAPQMDTFRMPLRGISSSKSSTVAGFSELEMDRYDDFNILSRSLTEISADVSEVLAQLEGFRSRVDADIDEFTELAHHLQDEITTARMVPIGNLYTRLTRTVRDASKAAGKPVHLALEGAETELDNNIVQQISDPLVHLVRNAVAHGVEDAEARVAAGKPEQGRIHIRAYHRGNHICIEVEDDGRGIDYEQARRSAEIAGLLSPAQAAVLSDREVRDLIFQPGFSTAISQTQLAGRGVGLDVVRSNIHALNGEVEVRSESGVGAVFTLTVPLTLIISQALFVSSGSSTFALPLALVEEIRRLRPQEIEDAGGKLFTRVRDVVTEVIRLDAQLGLPATEPVNGYYKMVIVKMAGRTMGIIVEEVIGKDEIVIKNLGEYLRHVKLFPGTTIAPDGSLILLIDLNRLVSLDTAPQRAGSVPASAARVFAPGAAAVAAGSLPAQSIDCVANEHVVLVVDDSISVRKFVGRMLEKAGYRVRLAGDGLEATEIVAQEGCNLVVTDIEMPRLNGYDLMSHLRQNPKTREIPVLVVTSRAGAKHRDRALKEGAAGFLTKPVQEEQLLAAVARLLRKERDDAAQPQGTLAPSVLPSGAAE
jgi:chemosensory pili system protein ChpA (sensor histidine kinase/response regulator)